MTKIHDEHKTEINRLKESIKHYKQELKKPAWKYIFSNETSHQIAKRMIEKNEKELK